MSSKIQSLKAIENSKINNSFSHAYLFYGEPGVDIFEIAFEAVKLMVCNDDKCINSKTIEELNYPDLLIINPEKNLIAKTDIVSMIKNMSNTALVKDNKKILIIKNIDLGNKQSLNSLLKYMEDPSENTHIIMTTNKIDLLISTIKSRAQNILVKRKTRNEIIKELKDNNFANNYINLFANIFPNYKKAKEVDMVKFENIYKEIFIALESGISNANKMKLELSSSIQKDNILYAINILEYFYYQTQTIIDEKYPLFPKYTSLINKHKSKDKKYGSMLHELSVLKKSILNKGNFNLQKEIFLLRMVKIYEG